MEELTLKSNGIGEKGLVALADALGETTTLKSIHLFGNEFGQISGKRYYDLIKHRFPYTDVKIDVHVYIVDRVYHIAEV